MSTLTKTESGGIVPKRKARLLRKNRMSNLRLGTKMNIAQGSEPFLYVCFESNNVKIWKFATEEAREKIFPTLSPFEKDPEPRFDEDVNDALVQYDRVFPHGFRIIPTPGDDLLCGFFAVIRSMAAMHPSLVRPSIPALQRVLHSPAYIEHATAFGLTNDSYFSVDQVGAVLFFWGREYGLNLRIGYAVGEGQIPYLLPHPDEFLANVVTVWIHNDGQGDVGGLGHFSGIRSV